MTRTVGSLVSAPLATVVWSRSADDRGSLNRRCIFLFVVKDLPDSEIYNVIVGHHAGGDYSTQEVDQAGAFTSPSAPRPTTALTDASCPSEASPC